ncbi:hypothetical protein RJ639_002091 [Escallonia herrerae]|uniref:GST N-terminal domain-containing protein n=1 Tax=Escallonia herrerae TaxID=1293975 RepID=A0AA88XBI3_9ASTE|nr:hypothetical protein RJ639_002091 [Escallonia herrerae]
MMNFIAILTLLPFLNDRLGKSLQCWILMSCFILAQKMVQIFVPKLLKWVENNNSLTWFDTFNILSPQVDPNTGVAMYESDDIIKYLVGKYGVLSQHSFTCVIFWHIMYSTILSDGNVPFFLSLGLLTTLTEGFAMIGRMGKPSPFCKVVREVLVEFELPHILHSCARGSPKRHILYQKAGHFQVPYLEDPNTGIGMFESAEIVEYLRATYAL